MKTIELNDDDWARLKRKLMTQSVDDAMKDYTPPVKLTHGNEYITYETGGEEDTGHQKSSKTAICSSQFPSATRTEPKKRFTNTKGRKMIPTLTTEQRRENLEKAKAARQRRAAILKGVADGSYTVPDVLNMAFTDDAVSRMKVFTLIKAAPGYGFARTQQTMRKLHISESRRLRGLGANQRAALVELFGGAR